MLRLHTLHLIETPHVDYEYFLHTSHRSTARHVRLVSFCTSLMSHKYSTELKDDDKEF